jgi:hypothetical protein
MYVIEMINPDGPHWFGGVVRNAEAAKGGVDLPMNLWSPYWQDAKHFINEESAQAVVDTTLKDAKGCYAVLAKKAKSEDSRSLSEIFDNACKMRARYLQKDDVFVMTNTRYVVTKADHETVTFNNADMFGIETGTQPFYNGNGNTMKRVAQYWVVLLGTTKTLRKPKPVDND